MWAWNLWPFWRARKLSKTTRVVSAGPRRQHEETPLAKDRTL